VRIDYAAHISPRTNARTFTTKLWVILDAAGNLQPHQERGELPGTISFRKSVQVRTEYLNYGGIELSLYKIVQAISTTTPLFEGSSTLACSVGSRFVKGAHEKPIPRRATAIIGAMATAKGAGRHCSLRVAH